MIVKKKTKKIESRKIEIGDNFEEEIINALLEIYLMGENYYLVNTLDCFLRTNIDTSNLRAIRRVWYRYEITAPSLVPRNLTIRIAHRYE